MRIVKPPLDPLGPAGTSILSNIRPLPSVLPAGFTLSNIRPLQNFPGNALFSPRHGDTGMGGEKDQLGKFLGLRESLATKQKAEPWVTFRYPEIRYDKLGLRGDFPDQMTDRELPPYGETLNADDPIVGPYIREIEDATTEVKKSYGGGKLRPKEYRTLLRTIALTSFTIAREMMMIIGRERYDLVRKRLRLKLNHFFSAQRFMNLPVYILANEFVDKYGAYRQVQPMQWTEELMLLALNPELTDAIIASPLSSRQNARDWAMRFAKEEKAESDIKAEARTKAVEKHINRQRHIEHIMGNPAVQALPREMIEFVARRISFLTPAQISLPVNRSNRNDSLSMAQMKGISANAISSMSEEKQEDFLHSLHRFAWAVAYSDDAYRGRHAGGYSLLASDAVMAAAKMAVKEDWRNSKVFEPFTEWIHDGGGSGRKRYRINVQQGDASQQHGPVLSLLDVIDMKKYFDKLPIDEAMAFVEEHGLENEIQEKLRDASSRAERAIADHRHSVRKNGPLWRYTQDGDSMYTLFAKLRYAFRIIPHLYPEIWSEVGKT